MNEPKTVVISKLKKKTLKKYVNIIDWYILSVLYIFSFYFRMIVSSTLVKYRILYVLMYEYVFVWISVFFKS